MTIEKGLRKALDERCQACGLRWTLTLIESKQFEIQVSPKRPIREVTREMIAFQTQDLIEQVRALVRLWARLNRQGYRSTFIDVCDHWFWVERRITIPKAAKLLTRARHLAIRLGIRCTQCGASASLPEPIHAS